MTEGGFVDYFFVIGRHGYHTGDVSGADGLAQKPVYVIWIFHFCASA